MKLVGVTLTGADDSVDPKEMLGISFDYPFVEWGILVSEGQFGMARFPSGKWILEMKKWQEIAFGYKLRNEVGARKTHWAKRFSLHLCGKIAKRVFLGIGNGDILGSSDYMRTKIDDSIYHSRLQLNLGSYLQVVKSPMPKFPMIKFQDNLFREPVDLLIQTHDESCLEKLTPIKSRYPRTYPFFDASGGNGITPERWISPPEEFNLVGYAGGLDVYNLRENLNKLSKMGNDKQSFWVDMESSLFNQLDNIGNFDLNLCCKVLDIARDFIDNE